MYIRISKILLASNSIGPVKLRFPFCGHIDKKVKC